MTRAQLVRPFAIDAVAGLAILVGGCGGPPAGSPSEIAEANKAVQEIRKAGHQDLKKELSTSSKKTKEDHQKQAAARKSAHRAATAR